MSELDHAPAAPFGDSPGARLRQAREAAGLDIDTLAANLRVAPAKLQLLEADRHGELPDRAFARALALTVCRALHIDPAPVLAGLPQAEQAQRLEQVNQGLNQPFGPRPSLLTLARRLGAGGLRAPGALLVVLLVIAALAVYLWPQWSDRVATAEPTPSVRTVTVPAAGAPPVQAGSPVASEPAQGLSSRLADAPVALAGPGSAAVPSVPAGPTPGLATTPVALAGQPSSTAASVAAPASPSAAPLLLRTTEPSWVEVRDGSGRTLLSRQLTAGESVQLEGRAPWRLRIGNAGGTELTLRGQRVDLAPHTRNNVARLELN